MNALRAGLRARPRRFGPGPAGNVGPTVVAFLAGYEARVSPDAPDRDALTVELDAISAQIADGEIDIPWK